MKTVVAILAIGFMFFTVGCKQDQTTDFAVETLALAIGYELSSGFEWNEDVDRYYTAIMEGKLSLDAAQAAEGYLRTVTHPLIANRLVRLAGMIGFDMDDLGGIAGVDSVDIHLLQIAAQGFKLGLTLN